MKPWRDLSVSFYSFCNLSPNLASDCLYDLFETNLNEQMLPSSLACNREWKMHLVYYFLFMPITLSLSQGDSTLLPGDRADGEAPEHFMQLLQRGRDLEPNHGSLFIV